MDASQKPDRFAVEGILVASGSGRIRLLLGEVALDLDEEDVLDTSVLASPPELDERRARAVRLELRVPARLVHLGAAKPYDEVIWRRGQLFALLTRRNETSKTLPTDFVASERAFFARYGIEIPAGEAT